MADIPDTTVNTTAEENQSDAGNQKQEKTFTQAEVDRIVSDRIRRETARYEKDIATKVAQARTEAERLAAMSAEQKAEAERAAREKELTDRETAITRRELRAQALETLNERGLPVMLADAILYTDAETCNASIDAMEKAFRAAVQSGVDERMRGNPPQTGTKKKDTTDTASMTDAEYYAHMSAQRRKG